MSDYSPPTDLAVALIEIRKLRNTVQMLSEKTVVLDFLLGFKNYMHDLDRECSPRILMGVEMSYSEKWRVILQHEDNRDAIVIRKRLDKYQLSHEVFCDIIDQFCGTLMTYRGHYFKQVEKEEDWRAIFKALEIESVDLQNSIKALASKHTTEEIKYTWEILTIRDDYPYQACAFVSGIPGDTKSQIEEFIRIDKLESDIRSIMILRDKTDKTKFKGEVVIIFKTSDASIEFYEEMIERDSENLLRIRFNQWTY